MEFETNNTPDRSSDIPNDTRLAAATRKVSIEPLHEVVAEEVSSETMGAQRALDAPIANIPTDTEVTVATPSGEATPDAIPAGTDPLAVDAAADSAHQASHRRALIAGIATAVVLAAVVCYAMFFNR